MGTKANTVAAPMRAQAARAAGEGTETMRGPMIRRYGLALLAVAAALGATLELQRLFDHPFVFLFFGAVMAAGWLGTGPGLLAVALSMLSVDYFLVAPFHSLV